MDARCSTCGALYDALIAPPEHAESVVETFAPRQWLCAYNRATMKPEVPVPAGPLLVTIAYFAIYYALHLHVLRTKKRLRNEYEARGVEFDRYYSQDRQMLAADRSVLNMLEHMPPFICLLWLHVVFVGSLGATVAGSVYVATRAAYPFLLGRSVRTRLPSRLLVATYTGYGVLLYLAAALCVAVSG